MQVQEQLAFELRRRAALLPSEVSTLKKLADKNENGWGIHQSQIKNVKEILDGLLKEQKEVLARLHPSLTLEEFAEKRSDIEKTLTGTHSILATFNYIFSQRDKSPEYKFLLDIADIIAAKCYLPCIKLANKWRGLPLEHFREPPLVYFNAMLSPAAITRSHAVNQVGLKMYGELEHLLPISIISLPFHDRAALWTYCSIYHEVGHLLDNDIGLRDNLENIVTKDLPESDRKRFWQLWLREMIADAFGVLLGGVAFGYALFTMLLKSAEDIRSFTTDKHTNDYVRIFLLGALLRATKVEPLAMAAGEIEQEWSGFYGQPAELSSYTNECERVANILLGEELEVLKGHKLVEFASTLSTDYQKTLDLSKWLRDVDQRPDPNTFPLQLVPAAAQMAAHDVRDNFAESYDDIQKRALDYLAKIKPPTFLDSSLESKEHQSYVRGMIKDLKFTMLNVDRS
jgi:hypothetical protein